MQGLVLAGGEGSRLSATGISVPKALVSVAGQPQLLRMIAACRRAGAETVTCALRDELVSAAADLVEAAGADVVAVHTPSSLHTLVAGLRAAPAGDVLCTLVDTVMRSAEWDRANASACVALQSADAVLAVTPFVSDDSPLWVDVAPDGTVVRVGVRGVRPLVTGGVYWFNPAARRAAADALDAGVSRLRGFLAWLIEHQMRVSAVEVPAIVDVDTSGDLDAAVALLKGER